jgi:hypothetical protein
MAWKWAKIIRQIPAQCAVHNGLLDNYISRMQQYRKVSIFIYPIYCMVAILLPNSVQQAVFTIPDKT